MKILKTVFIVFAAIFFFTATGKSSFAQIITETDLDGTYYAAEIKDKNNSKIHTSFKRLTFNGAGQYTYDQIFPAASSGTAFYTTYWGNGRVSVKVNEDSPFGDAKGAVSTDGSYLVLAETVFVSNNGMPDLILAIRESSGLTDAVLTGSYNLFIFYQTPAEEGWLINTNSGTFEASPGLLSGQFTETAQPLTGDYALTCAVAANGQLTVDMTSGAVVDIVDGMQGMISGDGNVFVAVETSTADNTQAFLIGVRQGQNALTVADIAGKYYLDDFGYYMLGEDNVQNDAASFISNFTVNEDGTSTLIEEDTTCDSCTCQECPIKGAPINGTVVVSPSGSQYTATLTDYPAGRKQGGQINLSPAGNLFTITNPLYLGIGIRQASGQIEQGEPVADAGPDQTVSGGDTVTLNGTGSVDSDGTIASYRWLPIDGDTALISAITLSDSTSPQPTFTAPMASGSVTFRLIVTDNEGKTGTDTVTVNVTASNNPPNADAGPDQTVNEGEMVTLDGSGSSDPDAAVLSYTWEQAGGPAVTLSDIHAAQPTFVAPAVDDQTSLSFTLTVEDDNAIMDSDTVTITVNNTAATNQPPIASAGTDRPVIPGETVTLDGSGSSDPDDGIGLYTWTQTAGPAVTLSDIHAVQPTFTAPPIDTPTPLTFQLTVQDHTGLTGTDTVDIIIDPDTNGNGIPDSLESTDTDLDGDGVLDFNDPDSIRFQGVNGGFMGFFTCCGELFEIRNLLDTDTTVPQTGRPTGTCPYGVFSYNITGLTPGTQAEVTFVFPEALPENAAFYKIDGNGWRSISFVRGELDNTIIVTLTDGDPLTDDDGEANGIIVDPSALVLTADDTTPDNTSGGGSSGGGCFIGSLMD